jgi:hypothetical protein
MEFRKHSRHETGSSFPLVIRSLQFFNLAGAIQAPIGNPFKTLGLAHHEGEIFFANSRSSRKPMLDS